MSRVLRGGATLTGHHSLYEAHREAHPAAKKPKYHGATGWSRKRAVPQRWAASQATKTLSVRLGGVCVWGMLGDAGGFGGYIKRRQSKNLEVKSLGDRRARTGLMVSKLAG